MSTNNTTAVRTTLPNGKQVVTITRGETVIVRKGKAEVRKGYAGTCVSNTTGEIHAFISVTIPAPAPWASEWEWVAITGDEVA
jgi:hypothetical protein